MNANMYIDSVSLSGQAIPGIPPAINPVPEPPPAETGPYPAPEGVTLYEDVLIGKAGDRDLYTSIAVPSTPPAEPMPVMIYIHGEAGTRATAKTPWAASATMSLNAGISAFP